MIKNKPSTPLPFVVGRPRNAPPCTPQEIAEGPHDIDSTGVPGYENYGVAKAGKRSIADYLVLSANAYPELVEALDRAEQVYAILCSDHGGGIPQRIAAAQEHVSAWRNLLRKLGER